MCDTVVERNIREFAGLDRVAMGTGAGMDVKGQELERVDCGTFMDPSECE